MQQYQLSFSLTGQVYIRIIYQTYRGGMFILALCLRPNAATTNLWYYTEKGDCNDTCRGVGAGGAGGGGGAPAPPIYDIQYYPLTQWNLQIKDNFRGVRDP